jgi:hypothetical protein
VTLPWAGMMNEYGYGFLLADLEEMWKFGRSAY